MCMRRNLITGCVRLALPHHSVPSNTDKRCKNIYLTEKAYDIQRRMENQRRKLDKMLTIGMNKKEIEALEKMLNKVLYNIAEP